MTDERYINTTEAARLFGLDKSQVARLARESRRVGNEFPVKRGRAWEATIEQWSIVLSPPGKVQRKKREIGKVQVDRKNIKTIDQGITCIKAASIYGISASWAARLAKRAIKKGYSWPRKINGQWIATPEQWERIFFDPKLTAWKRKK